MSAAYLSLLDLCRFGGDSLLKVMISGLVSLGYQYQDHTRIIPGRYCDGTKKIPIPVARLKDCKAFRKLQTAILMVTKYKNKSRRTRSLTLHRFHTWNSEDAPPGVPSEDLLGGSHGGAQRRYPGWMNACSGAGDGQRDHAFIHPGEGRVVLQGIPPEDTPGGPPGDITV